MRQEKEERKGEDILKIFDGTSLSILSSLDLVFPIFILFFNHKKYFFPFFNVCCWSLASHEKKNTYTWSTTKKINFLCLFFDIYL